jgi:hypothetical protein
MGRLQYDVSTIFLTILDHWNLSANSLDQRRSRIDYGSAEAPNAQTEGKLRLYLGAPELLFFPSNCRHRRSMSQPHFGQVWGWSPTLGKVRDLEFSGTPECSELNSKGKNTSHWGVLSVVGKVLKRRYRKWPCIDHSDNCSPSYGQKKGRESNWQFDSRPLKLGNRPLSDIRFERATWRWKDLDKGYNFASDLVAIGLCSRELWRFKIPGVPLGQFRDSISGVLGICAIWM